MSSPAPSNISQNNTEILKKQQQEMQQRHEEQQQLLAQLEEAAKLCWAECAGQKARRKAKAKAKAKSCRGGGEEEEDKGVPPATSGWGARGRGHPIGGGWKIPGHRVLLYTSPSICQDRWRWTLFYFPFSFYFTFLFFSFFTFLFLEQLGLGLIGHAVTSVTSWWRSHKTDHEK